MTAEPVPATNPISTGMIGWDDLPFAELYGSRGVILPLPPGGPDSPIIYVADYPPHYFAPTHSHAGGHVEVILSGSMTVGGVERRVGDTRIEHAEVAYGPIVVGPDGCRALEFFESRAALATRMTPEDRARLVGDRDPGAEEAKMRQLLSLEFPEPDAPHGGG